MFVPSLRCRSERILGASVVKRTASGLGIMTNETDAAVEKLRRIEQLWHELGRTKVDSPQYEPLIEKIRALSAEYEAILPPKTRS